MRSAFSSSPRTAALPRRQRALASGPVRHPVVRQARTVNFSAYSGKPAKNRRVTPSNVEDPGYMEDPVPPRVPDPPYRPIPPR